jgi:hypothetical protein
MLFLLINFIVNNQEMFQTSSFVDIINTRNKHHLHRPSANLPCFQESAFCTGIKIFNSLLLSLISLRNEMAQFKVAPTGYLHTPFTLLMNFCCFRMIHNTIYEIFVVFCIVIILYILHILCDYDLFHILLSIWQTSDPWNVCVYIK